ncbi:hypothetical protein JK386_02365 [Nocardioides sp. zg-536]|uniref:Uncharacterized protein n=1 Tax=Nocardioides faecalis TaxID=2803858 RepID=A0A938XYD4_9ACTN|nr:hypothetical protein [Nocardioides faecalis]MBM9458732.1 hypothetical protein [Nocardioides faecalis]QVI58717.1 hypothetical protein KG111_17460 [Nocardioides faecalis]
MSNNYWTDWQQNRRIEEAEERLDAERRARSRLAEHMRRQQGDLQSQIDRLTRAFVALVEHEDIRAELGQHADAAALRRYAREVVATVIVTGGAALRGVAEPGDVPGYWLAAAARGVASIARGEAGGEELLAEARRRDPVRAALFGCLLAAQTRDPRWAPADLAAVLPDGTTIATAQRRIWLAVAEGRLAPADVDAPGQLVTALRRVVESDPVAIEARVTDWLSKRAATSSKALPAEKAAAELDALRTLLTHGTDTAPQPRSAARGGVVASFLGADLDADPVAPSDPADLPPEDPEADCLRSLVDEGSPAEGDILQRMVAVRADLGFLDERAASMTSTYTEPAGDVTQLVLEDLAAGPGSPVSDVALRVLAPTLGRLAEDLGRRAAAAPEATKDVNAVGGGASIRVGTAGPVGEWRGPVTESVLRRHPIGAWMQPTGIGLAALGAVLTVLGLLLPGLVGIGVVLLLGGGGLLGWMFHRRQQRTSDLASTLEATEQRVDQTRHELIEEHSRAASAAGSAQAALGVVRRQLGVVTG